LTCSKLIQRRFKKIKNPITELILDWIPYPEADSWNMMHKRLSECLKKIENDRYDLTVLVSHGNSIISLIHSWLGFSNDLFKISFDIQPCSIAHLRINSWNEKTISKLNDVSHLEKKGIYRDDNYFS
jgi:broad specificity phosphatase PhoE